MSILSNIVDNIKAWLRPGMTPEEKAAELDKMAADAGEKLDWRNSVVDLMKLTNQDSSLDARAALAKELGHPGTFTGTPEQNIWLRQQVLGRLKL